MGPHPISDSGRGPAYPAISQEEAVETLATPRSTALHCVSSGELSFLSFYQKKGVVTWVPSALPPLITLLRNHERRRCVRQMRCDAMGRTSRSGALLSYVADDTQIARTRMDGPNDRQAVVDHLLASPRLTSLLLPLPLSLVDHIITARVP
ncbi:hypothetical protein BHM03_00045973 [Ensete ventricosum]|nr:hypothetical protein BHM03_00045973 [Ensete ventricosum]